MATQKVRPDPGALQRQHRDQRRQVTKRKAGVYALVAGLVLAGLIVGGSALRQGSDPASGGGLATEDLIGLWARSGTGEGDDFAYVKFYPDGTFTAGHFKMLLFNPRAPAAGTYELADGTITFVVKKRADFCEPETWIWEAELEAERRLRTQSVEGTNCGVPLGTETWEWLEP